MDRESDYSRRRLNRTLSPSRGEGSEGRTYADALRESALERERQETLRSIENKRKRQERDGADASADAAEGLRGTDGAGPGPSSAAAGDEAARKRRAAEWDHEDGAASTADAGSRWDATPARDGAAVGGGGGGSRWDATPAQGSRWDATPAPGSQTASRWDATPARDAGAGASSGKRSRWDVAPSATPAAPLGDGATPKWGATPSWGAATPAWGGATPAAGSFAGPAETPVHGASAVPMTPDAVLAARVEREIDARNRPLTDEDLDALLPGVAEGYQVLPPPPGYVPLMTPARKLAATPTPVAGTPLYAIPQEDRAQAYDLPVSMPEGLPDMRPEDAQYFGKLLEEVDEAALTLEEAKARRISKLLLKIKNGAPPQRKSALRQLTERARDFGAGPLFDAILPLLMSPTLEEQERHLLVKVIDRLLFRLDELVRPYVHKILVVVEPLLIDEEYTTRAEGREIVANLAKAAGLATMIAAMRPDVDDADEYVRNTTARAFSVVASALGVQALLPFVRAVCASKRSWQARHTGAKIVQQIAILSGCSVLPHLRGLVEAVRRGLEDESQKVRTMTALALAALAESAAPYGIESFDDVLEPLWKGIRLQRGKALAAYLKAIGQIIPLMDAVYANYYTREVMVVLLREFASPDEEMGRIVLGVLANCAATEGVEAQYLRDAVLPDFFKHFWTRKAALDRRSRKALLEATLALARRVGARDALARLSPDLKDESEPYRRAVAQAVAKVLEELGAAEVDARLEEELVDGALYAWQEQGAEDDSRAVVDAFAALLRSLGTRARPYLPQVAGTVKWRLNNKSARVRELAAELVARTAATVSECGEERLLAHLSVVLFENLGEEYPDVLAAILNALGAIVAVIGMDRMTPPVKDLVPRLTPILKNRHEGVQEACIGLVGRIADRGAEHVPAREWMRICFELLETLRAQKKAIRRAAVNAFGYIARAIGPQDVTATLLNNLRVQERQNRVCTTVALAVVAETCAPFTVLPALMNEYRVPDLNVQNGVLKAISFLFEYIGETAKDYIYAVTPLLADALSDRDLVHRQTAISAVAHAALGLAGLGTEDALVHLLNHVWPNAFESSAHIVQAFNFCVDACRLALGPGAVLAYLLQGLFHPARKVRTVYWRLYNQTLVGGQDSLVAYYPDMPDDENNTYHRHELDIFV